MSGTFEELEVWKKARRLAVRIHALLKNCRDFGMKDQMFRAAVSIASNIAEGSERKSNADFRRFIFFAKGSAAELRTQTYISGSIGILKQDEMESVCDELETISKMLQGLATSLKYKQAK
jgi:four helix bundle protein